MAYLAIMFCICMCVLILRDKKFSVFAEFVQTLKFFINMCALISIAAIDPFLCDGSFKFSQVGS